MRFGIRALTIIAAGYLLTRVALFFSGSSGTKRHHIEAAVFLFAALACIAIGSSSRRWPRAGERADVPLVSVAIVLACLGTATFWRALDVGLLSDDFVLQSWAMTGRWLGEGSAFARPLVLRLWRLVLDLGGGDRTLHFANLALHGVNTVLAVLIARRTGLTRIASLAAGSVVSLWPTQVEPVFWTSGMFDVAMTSCVLGCIAINPFTRTIPRSAALTGILVLAAGALLCKETAIALPVLWAVCYGPQYVNQREDRRWIVSVWLCLLGVCAAYLMWRYQQALPLSGFSELNRYVVKEQLSRTIAGLTIPLDVTTVAAHPWIPIVLALWAVATALIAALSPSDGAEYVAVQGVAWALAAAAPAIGYLFIGEHLDGSRYLYLPSVGWGMFAAAGLDRSRGRLWAIPLWAVFGVVLLISVRERQYLTKQWIEAAAARDRILSDAAAAADRFDCAALTAAGLPSRHLGAQLFNNGFAEAFARRAPRLSGTQSCPLEWTGRGFQRSP